MCPEPIRHGHVLRFMATLRLPLWIVLLVTLLVSRLAADGVAPRASRSVDMLIDPALSQVVSSWLVLMVPVGMPLLYFLGGLVAHVGVALTGGAPRSIGASMRAVGYALGPALLVIGGLDVPLYLGRIPSEVYLGVMSAVGAFFLWLVAFGLARTHQISMPRGILVGILPTLVVLAVTVARAGLELPTLPGVPLPDSPYWVP